MKKQNIPIDSIQTKIVLIRGEKVLLDRDLAEMYEVETFNKNKAVKRNIDRFPEDFMFQISKNKWNNLKFHFGISNSHGGRRTPPYVFTEHGVAMLSSVLRSSQAVQVNIAMEEIISKKIEESINTKVCKKMDFSEPNGWQKNNQ